MILTRSRPLAVAVAAVAIAIPAVFEPARAQGQEPPTAICRVVWHDDGTGKGDTRTTDADFTLPKYSPDATGAFTVFGSGDGSVAYHSATGCPVTKGSPWKQHFDVTLSSDDGKTGKIEFEASDESHSITVACGRGATYDVEASSLPLTTVTLKDGVASDYSWSKAGGLAGSKGKITFYFCKK